DADEELGRFDGLIVDVTVRPRYIVVAARGVFGSRYLLPVGHVGFDERQRVLRVRLDKAVAERYPAFDRDEFETMSDERLRGYEAGLLEFFPRDAGGRRKAGSIDQGEPPEWLMTGVWVTMP